MKEETSRPKIHKIVLTGGPCAGKTTGMSWIQNAFSKLGYKVLFVPETATELITGGVTPWGCGRNLYRDLFQGNVGPALPLYVIAYIDQYAGDPRAEVFLFPQGIPLFPGFQGRVLQRVLHVGPVPQDRPGHPEHHFRAGFDLCCEGSSVHGVLPPFFVTLHSLDG